MCAFSRSQIAATNPALRGSQSGLPALTDGRSNWPRAWRRVSQSCLSSGLERAGAESLKDDLLKAGLSLPGGFFLSGSRANEAL